MNAPQRRRAVIIVNPVSGRATARKRAGEVEQLLIREGVAVTLHATTGPGSGREIAAAVADDCDVIVSVGGDGTLNEVLNGIVDAGAETPVTPVPTGTANVVAQDLGLPRDLPSLARIAAGGRTRSLDLGWAGTPQPRRGGRRFVMCAGVGFDAAIVAAVHDRRSPRGITISAYYLPAVRVLCQYPFPPMRVIVDGVTVEELSTFTIIGNLRGYGGPFRFFNTARADDGILDVCCFHGRGTLTFLRYGWGAWRHSLHRHGDVTFHRGTTIEISAEQPVPVQVDGDPYGELPMRFEVLPAAVRFCVGGEEPD